MAFRYACFVASPSSCLRYRSTFSFSVARVCVFLPISFWDRGPGRSPHVKAPAIKPSLCPGTSNVAFVNLVKYSLTVSPSFCFQSIMEYESPLYFHTCMNFVRNRYFSFPKLYMLPGRSVLNHVPTLPSRGVGKYVHQNHLSSLSDVIVHSYVTMWLSGSVDSYRSFSVGL